ASPLGPSAATTTALRVLVDALGGPGLDADELHPKLVARSSWLGQTVPDAAADAYGLALEIEGEIVDGTYLEGLVVAQARPARADVDESWFTGILGHGSPRSKSAEYT